MPSSSDTLKALEHVQHVLGVNNTGAVFEALLELEEAAWTAGYEAAKAGYERLLPL